VNRDYKTLTVKLSPRAHAGLTAWCGEHGVSITSAIEVLGELVGDGGLDGLSESTLVEQARRVDAGRRSRRNSGT
jgi:hypothetical protein